MKTRYAMFRMAMGIWEEGEYILSWEKMKRVKIQTVPGGCETVKPRFVKLGVPRGDYRLIGSLMLKFRTSSSCALGTVIAVKAGAVVSKHKD